MTEISFIFYFIIVFLLFLSAFFSASEAAFISIGKHVYQKILETDEKKAKKLEFWFKNPERILTTILVGNNIVNILASVVAANISYQIFHKIFTSAITGIMTFLILIFGEIVPKSIGKKHAEKITILAIQPLKVLSILIMPIVKILIFFSNIFLKIFKEKVETIMPGLTEEDVKAMITIGEEEGIIEEEEKEMLHSIFEFGDKMVKEIMTPRVNIVAVEENTKLGEVIEIISKHGYSRVPVYRENIDKIVGLLYIKDIIAKQKEENWKDLKAKEIKREVYFVPETKKILELLRELQMMKLQMAIVIDEYGGTAGLVTMEDLVEEIVGEISDEFKKDEKEYIQLRENAYLVKGSMEKEKLEKLIEIKIPEIDIETVAGLVLTNLGKIPKKGESFEYNGYKFVVQDVSDKIINWVKIEKIEGEENDRKGDQN